MTPAGSRKGSVIQPDAGPVGSVEVMMPPEPLVVTHRVTVGHEMLVRL